MTLEEAKKEIDFLLQENELLIIDNENRVGGKDLFSRGTYYGLQQAKETLEKVEPVGNPEQLTLTELAHELRKILKFDYLTCDGSGNLRDYCIWLDKPDYVAEEGWTLQLRYEFVTPLLVLESYRMAVNIDLSEYKDEQGNIDYSKCIVEVE